MAYRWHQSPRPAASVSAKETTEDTDEPIAEPVAVNPGYVGPQACAACHSQRVREFQATRHFHACRVPQTDIMPPGFAAGRGRFATRDPALQFEMTQSGAEFFQNTLRQTPAGEKRLASHIDLAYGAGGADEVFFSWQDEHVTELPMVWLNPLQRWASSPFDLNRPGDCSQETTTRCLECHNTWIPHVAGTVNHYKQDQLILGITCERCHGPGREHVAFHESHPGAESARAIVNPARLSRDRQMDLCSQCHSNTTRPRGPAFRYQPGEPLEAYFRTAKTERFEDDHVANQTKYLRQSKCFLKSDALTCTTCHNPHRARATGAPSSQTCLKCHKTVECGEQPQLPEAVRGDCVGCHMPPRIKINIFFHTETDRYVAPIRRAQHRVGIYPEARDEVLLTWHRRQEDPQSRQRAVQLTKSLNQHWLAEAEKYRRDYRFLAAIGAVREALRVESTPAAQEKLQELIVIMDKLADSVGHASRQLSQRQYPEAAKALGEILAIKPDLGIAHGKLGTAYAVMGQKELAVQHLKAVARFDPDNPYGESMLGWLAYLDGRPEAALESYRQAAAIDPYNAKLSYQMGLAWVSLKKWSEAAACFREALKIDPRNAEATLSFSLALRELDQRTETLLWARRAVALTRHQAPEALLNLAEAYAGLGRMTEAEAVAVQALELAQAKNPELVSQISERLWKWRAGPP